MSRKVAKCDRWTKGDFRSPLQPVTALLSIIVRLRQKESNERREGKEIKKSNSPRNSSNEKRLRRPKKVTQRGALSSSEVLSQLSAQFELPWGREKMRERTRCETKGSFDFGARLSTTRCLSANGHHLTRFQQCDQKSLPERGQEIERRG